MNKERITVEKKYIIMVKSTRKEEDASTTVLLVAVCGSGCGQCTDLLDHLVLSVN
jgi:hypothetical protein